MNFLLILSLLVFAFLVYLSFTWRKQLHRFAHKFINIRHQQILSMFQSTPVKSNAIIFLGDSITEGANWNELFNNSRIINRGIGGDTTQGVLNRLDEIVRHQAKKIFICIGTNDIGMGLDTEKITTNYNLILEKLEQENPNTQLYVQSILPVNLSKKSVFGHNNKGILLVNEQLKALCSKKGIHYLDLHEHFIDDAGKLKNGYTNDGLHLLGNAYLHWTELIKPMIEN